MAWLLPGSAPLEKLEQANIILAIFWHDPLGVDLSDDLLFGQCRRRSMSSKKTFWFCLQVHVRKVGWLSIQLGFGQVPLFSKQRQHFCLLHALYSACIHGWSVTLSGLSQGPPVGKLLLKAGRIYGKLSDEHGAQPFF